MRYPVDSVPFPSSARFAPNQHRSFACAVVSRKRLSHGWGAIRCRWIEGLTKGPTGAVPFIRVIEIDELTVAPKQNANPPGFIVGHGRSQTSWGIDE